MMQSILVPLDGSVLAERSLPYARMLALALGARVRLLRVIVDAPGNDMVAESIAAAYGVQEPLNVQQERRIHSQEILRQNAERYLETHAAPLAADGVEVAIDVRYGPAADVIVEAALEQHVKMIVMATHGYSGIKRWALGSVTDKVVHATSTPIFVVRAEVPAQPPALKRILMPLDGSALARQALPLAAELAKSAQCELLLLQAVPATVEAYPGFASRGRPIPQLADLIESLRDQAATELGDQADQLREHGLPASTYVVNGHAAEVLVDEARRHSADLIVMATHGYSGIKRWTLGSVADKVLHATRTPLLLVRAQPQVGG
jgi:nucleotide-binding universal stress UspA family protein